MAKDLAQYAPKYRIVAEKLRTEIKKGLYDLDMALPTEEALIGRYGVSRTTIRSALDLLVEEKVVTRNRGKGSFVSFFSKKMKCKTLIFAYPEAIALAHPYLSRLYRSFDEAVRKYSDSNDVKFSTQCIRAAETNNDSSYTLLSAEDSIQAQIINPHLVHGLCIAVPLTKQDISEIKSREISCVRLGGSGQDDLPVIRYDYIAPARLVIQHFRDLGHRKIGLVMEKSLRSRVGQNLVDGLVSWSKAIGININDKTDVVWCNYQHKSDIEQVKELLSRADRPTALYCFDDFLAMDARDAANELGLSVPDDLSIVGLGNYVADSEISTVTIPLEKMGQETARILIEQVFDGQQQHREHVVDGYELIARKSSGKAPVE